MRKILFLLVGLLAYCQAESQNREIEFEKSTLQDALNKATAAGKMAFVDCYTEYCGPCKTMAALVFTLDSVADFFNSNFVNVKLDMLSEDGKQYADKYKIGAYPSFLLLNGKGELLYKFVGGKSADVFMAEIRKGMKPDNRVKSMDDTYATGKYSNDFLREYVQLKLQLLEKGESLRLGKEYFDKISPEERLQPENWFLFADRTLGGINSTNMRYLLEHWQDFVRVQGEEKVYERITAFYRDMTEWVLQGWYFRDFERNPEDFVYYRQRISAIPLPCQNGYLVMMDVAKAVTLNDSLTVRGLLEDHVADFSNENQQIMFGGMGWFPSYNGVYHEQLLEIARKVVQGGSTSNLANYLKTLLNPDEAYVGEKYDVQNLKDKIGSTMIVPFFHPAKPLFWYSYEKQPGERAYYAYDPKEGKREVYNYRIIDSLVREILPGEEERIYYNPEFDDNGLVAKLEVGGKIFVYDAKNKALIPSERKKYPSIRPYGVSPDLRYELIVKEYNLWLEDKEQKKQVQLTFDGDKDYEFETANTEWLSDDGTFYLTREDKRNIRTFPLVYSLREPAPTVSEYKYELPGDTAVLKQELFIGNVKTGMFKKVDVVKWRGQLLEVLKVADVQDRVFFIRKKGTRNEFELCSVDAKTGEVKVILHEVSKPYLNEELFSCRVLNGGKDILLWSDRSGWGHYYHYDGNGKLLNVVTSGEWTAGRIMKIDTVKKQIYLYGFGKEKGRNPNYTYLYRVGFNGKRLTLLTPENATHSTFVHLGGGLIVDNFSRVDTVPQISVRDINGRLLTILEKADVSHLLAYGWKYPEQFTVKAADGKTDLYGIMWKPYDFDPSKKYPIVSQVYPGPQTETVWTDFTVLDRYNNTALAQRGIIVVCFGHRGGSPFRDKAYATYGYGNLRDYALADDKAGLEQLGRKYSFIDTNRVGIFGHSGGGMMAFAAICTYPDFYKVAVASSGNHDNRIYNRTWGETYQGIGDDYKFTVKTNQKLAKYLKGRLLLVTGEVDNNVHPANTYRVVNELILQGKDFDLLILPNQGHAFDGPYKSYFEKKKRDYFTKYLLAE